MYRKFLVSVLYTIVAGLGFIDSFATKIDAPGSELRRMRETESSSFPLAVVGDLQRTSFWEYMMGRESNDFERKEITENISEHNPGSVVLLGDMVFEGDNIDHWKYFDTVMTPIINKNVPVFPVIGNHEYWGKNRIALQYLTQTFQVLKGSHWYTERCDSVALIFLDSNDLEYSSEDWQTQLDWFKNKLLLYDNDPSIRGILVFAHHPPYTNSLITGDEMQVQLGFVPAFDKSPKTLAFITGHAHTYERFIENGKTFIVSGGGGGPRVELKTGPDIHYDYFQGPSPRPFNYLLINREADGLSVTVKGLKKGSTDFFTLEHFALPFGK